VTFRVQGRDPNIFKARYFVQNSLGGICTLWAPSSIILQ